jgi:hypothetical protein
MDHSDPGVDGISGTGEVHHLAVDDDLALVGAIQAVEDVHQCGLAGAILSEQAEDLP